VGTPIVLSDAGDEPEPIAIEVLGGELWVATGSRELRHVDLRTEQVVGRALRIPDFSYYFVAAGGALWTVDQRGGRVLRVDPRTGARRAAAVEGAVISPPAPGRNGISVAAGSPRDTELVRLDARSALPTSGPLPLAVRTRALTETGGSLWAADERRRAVVRIDPESGRIQAEPIPVPGIPIQLIAAGGYLWALVEKQSGPRGSVVRIDVRRAQRVGPPITVRGVPRALAAAGDRVWIASRQEVKSHDELRNFLAETDRTNVGWLATYHARSGREVERRVRIGSYPLDMVRAGGSLWIADGLEHSVRRVTPGLPGADKLPPTPRAQRESQQLERLRRALRIEPSRELGCEPGDRQRSLGPPAPGHVRAHKVSAAVKIEWEFAALPESDACRPYAVLATVYTGEPASPTYRNSTETVRVQGRHGRALVSLRYLDGPPYTALVTSAAITNARSSPIEVPVR
jgi:hypothetical protein